MGHAASRQHRRVARKSRYDEWVVDAFSGLIRGWPLDDPTGASAFREVTGSGDTASISGTYALQQGSLVGGVAGSVKGGGSTAVGKPGDLSVLDVGSSDSFTAIAWVGRLPPENGTNQIVFQKDGFPGWLVEIADQGDGYLPRARFRDSNDDQAAPSAQKRTQSEWNDLTPVMLAIVLDRSNDQARIYFNGAEEGAADASTVDDTSNSTTVKVARSDNRAVTHQHQYAFDNALSDTEITALYEQGAEFFDRGRLL